MWQLEGEVASAQTGDCSLAVSLSAGDRKLRIQSSDSTLLATLWEMPAVADQPLNEAYVRGDDLVCLLGPTNRFPFHTQLHWTVRQPTGGSPEPLVAVSLLVAVRTDSLDTQPAIESRSSAPHCLLETFTTASGSAFVMPIHEQFMLVDYAMPEDCAKQTAHKVGDGPAVVERMLFDHFLEKGVIRSGRLFAAIVAGNIEDQAIEDLCHEWSAAELPLTT